MDAQVQKQYCALPFANTQGKEISTYVNLVYMLVCTDMVIKHKLEGTQWSTYFSIGQPPVTENLLSFIFISTHWVMACYRKQLLLHN